MKKEQIVSALIGLAGAVSNNGTTDRTDDVIRAALLGEDAEKETVKLIHEEKFRISPNCATCQNPCGNTSDYDISRFHEGEEKVRNEKERLLDTIICYLQECDSTEKLPEIIYRAIAYLGYELEVNSYEKMIAQIHALKA